jgi:hypothetical protein
MRKGSKALPPDHRVNAAIDAVDRWKIHLASFKAHWFDDRYDFLNALHNMRLDAKTPAQFRRRCAQLIDRVITESPAEKLQLLLCISVGGEAPPPAEFFEAVTEWLQLQLPVSPAPPDGGKHL